ncbi:MAG: hypothetical protein NVV70_03765 [Cellulomonas sp.]|nr:hypothetical protein [Cellulomonas sp.]MCR6647285.1 hypothetical protein [Cellulomonas sp.]
MARRHGLKLNAWDHQAMQFLRSVGYARPHQVACWLGASTSLTRQRLARLAADGLAVSWSVSMNLHDHLGRVRPYPVKVWTLTKRGTGLLGPIEVVSSLLELPKLTHVKALPTGQNLTHDLVAVEHLLAWRAWGAEIATVREIVASERDLNGTHQKTELPKPKHWLGVREHTIVGTDPTHASDGGAVLDNLSWQVEIELACKPVKTSRADIAAMHRGPHRQIWYVEQQAAREHLIEAASAVTAGEIVAEATWRSNDHRIWVVPSLGRGPIDGESASFNAPAYVSSLVHPIARELAPAGRERADLRAAWERRPDVASLAARTRAARAARADEPAVAPVPAFEPASTLPSLQERLALLRWATEQAREGAFPPGAYELGPGVGLFADWDGTAFGRLRVAA